MQMKKIVLLLLEIFCSQYLFCKNCSDTLDCDSIIYDARCFINYATQERKLFRYTVYVINIVEYDNIEKNYSYSISYIGNLHELKDVKPDFYLKIDNHLVIVKSNKNSIKCAELRPINDSIKKIVASVLFDDSKPLTGVFREMALIKIIKRYGIEIDKSIYIRIRNEYPDEYDPYYVPDLLIKTIKTEDILNSSKPDTFFIAPKK